MSNLKKNLLAAAVALSAVGSAQAAPSFAAGESAIFFNNFENLYRSSQVCGAVPGSCLASVAGDPAGMQRINPAIAGNVIVGDIFVGILNVQNVASTVSGSDTYNSNPGDRFTGYFAQRVDAINFVLPTEAVLTLGTAVDPFGILAAGEMYRFYANTPTFASGGSATNVTANIAAATAGTLWASMGLGAEGYAYTTTNLAVTVATSATEAFMAMDILVQGPAYNAGQLEFLNDFNEDAVGGLKPNAANQVCTAADIANPALVCTQIVASSEIEANAQFGTNSPWMFASNDPAELNRIPEPGTLVLAGLALAGLGFSRRKNVA